MSPLDRECRVFCRYLIGRPPGLETSATYARYHAALGQRLTGDGFDRLLVTVARLSPVLAQPADAYARFFRPRGLLRKKLVLLLAILESCYPSHQQVDAVDACGDFRLACRVLLSVLVAGISLAVGVICFLPCQLLHAGLRRLMRRPEASRRINRVPPTTSVVELPAPLSSAPQRVVV